MYFLRLFLNPLPLLPNKLKYDFYELIKKQKENPVVQRNSEIIPST